MQKILFLSLLFFSCTPCFKVTAQVQHTGYDTGIVVGAARFDQYLPLLKEKRIAIILNQTSVIGSVSLVDTLISLGVQVKKLFAPEHGFRGTEDAGAIITDEKDLKTGLPVISLYGNHRKPTKEDLLDIDIVIFDIQDVGARFYTFISTMTYSMEACAANNKEFIVLDRPNPNGFYVDGPLLKPGFSSFVGLHPVPVVHGMTIGEYARMVNGEHWLTDSLTCNLTVIGCLHYNHHSLYKLPVNPSPNLPNMTAIYLYPSICFFEGCKVSVGRGTNLPFQLIGYPTFPDSVTSFTPKAMPGAMEPPFKNQLCFGYNLSIFNYGFFETQHRLILSWLMEFYAKSNDKSHFFNSYFDQLAGTDQLRLDIINGKTEKQITQSWQDDLLQFKLIRKKYLLYKDFE